MLKKILEKFTFWRGIAALILLSGVYFTYVRFVYGLGAVTNLSDEFPWGIWIGFDILCGVGLAAGGFTISAVTHIFNIEKFKPLSRPAILTAFLGYAFVALALMFDLGKPYNIWHPLIMWNPSSVMFEVAWCVMLYLTVLFLEFLSFALEKFQWQKTLTLLRKVIVPIYILGIVLSTLHQSSLGSMYLIIPQKMHPLWYSSFLPVYFYLSAIAVGFAMVIFESYTSARGMGHKIEFPLLSEISRITMAFLVITLAMRLVDIVLEGKLAFLFKPEIETFMFYIEIGIGTIVPAILLSSKKFRMDRKWLYLTSVLVVTGFILNRLNVSVTSIIYTTGDIYFPSLGEISITMSLVVVGIIVFKWLSNYFPVFEHKAEEKESLISFETPHELAPSK
ncbi:MAG: Ni/Fe-hydrogenase cytochrome b subunit [Melioribacteraceae bacterium]|nr:Ni/Fe-hydrogenase cytochrome b subunit [Melioribacteraceae bacterium]MCF8263683.1 Ni/Fe-hydrogenase cytochrome b subunit [Melioribacteraceae bacterium]MCF8414378.1 Ni/Fe-hydrogenase cytochrome b subunit [Melioribacteraceae bacterium]MCF8431070.1 Ni/Fe-hydrogenase cytochrome b subunit [Melioribacteraceae bacterium]